MRYEIRLDELGEDYCIADNLKGTTSGISDSGYGDFTAAEANIIVWALNQIVAGRVIVALVDPTVATGGPRFAGFYCEDYTGPTEGVAP